MDAAPPSTTNPPAAHLRATSPAPASPRLPLPRRVPDLATLAAILVILAILLVTLTTGCGSAPVPYGRESQITLGLNRPQVWAVAPLINLSGQPGIDPLIHADLVFQQLQQIKGVTAIPVDRVVTVYAALGLERVQSPEQAALICDLLGADALLVPTLTAWEPYNPPKMGASLQLFGKPGNFSRPDGIDPRELARQMAPPPGATLPPSGRAGFYQAAAMFDAADGSVRDSLRRYSYGRHDPLSPYGEREFVVSSDRYATFVYRRLTEQLLDQIYYRRPPEGDPSAAGGATPPKSTPSSQNPDGVPAGPQPFPSNRR